MFLFTHFLSFRLSIKNNSNKQFQFLKQNKMGSDSEDDLMFAQICHLVATNMDSVILQYPQLWGLTELPERNPECEDVPLPQPLDDFRSQFRMSRRCFGDILSKLAHSSRIRNLEKKLMFSLWMLSSQESYEAVGERFGLSKSSAHLGFNEILDGILSMFADYVRWPSASEYPEISQAFKEKSGGYIPGIIGAINTCHFEIKQPRGDSKDYCNERLGYSIILQAVCDHRKIFTDVYVGSPGSLSDGTVFRESNIYKQLDKLIPGEYHLVGDSSYPLIRNLVIPFPETGQLSESKARFNTLLGKAGETIKRALCMLRGRFQKLKYLDTSNPELANKIVCSCITLHNHVRMNDVDEDEEEFIEDPVLQTPNTARDEKWDIRIERKKAGYIKRNYLMSLCD